MLLSSFVNGQVARDTAAATFSWYEKALELWEATGSIAMGEEEPLHLRMGEPLQMKTLFFGTRPPESLQWPTLVCIRTSPSFSLVLPLCRI